MRSTFFLPTRPKTVDLILDGFIHRVPPKILDVLRNEGQGGEKVRKSKYEFGLRHFPFRLRLSVLVHRSSGDLLDDIEPKCESTLEQSTCVLTSTSQGTRTVILLRSVSLQ